MIPTRPRCSVSTISYTFFLLLAVRLGRPGIVPFFYLWFSNRGFRCHWLGSFPRRYRDPSDRPAGQRQAILQPEIAGGKKSKHDCACNEPEPLVAGLRPETHAGE